MRYIGIDPGPQQSGAVVWEKGRMVAKGIMPNRAIADRLSQIGGGDTKLIVEMVSPFGFVGASIFETCIAIGYFERAWGDRPVRRVLRKTVVAKLTGRGKGGDPEVREALIQLIGPIGKKAEPGPLFGVKGHEWSALALAVVGELLDQDDVDRVAG